MHSTFFTGAKGKKYVVEKHIATGGEGEIYYLRDGLCAKIYLKKVLDTNTEIANKIIYMVDHPPVSSAMNFMAWPIDYLVSDGKFIGFVMENLSQYMELRLLYSYSIQKNPDLAINLQVALNLAYLVKCIHDSDYIIGDFNPKNIGYSQRGTVCVYDNDSFQFIDKTNDRLFRCVVQFPGYVAPEIMEESNKIKQKMILAGKDANKMSLRDLERGFSKNTDNFALSVHIFQLMMNGFNPFSSIPRAAERSCDVKRIADSSSSTLLPSSDDNVLYDRFCFNPDRQPFNKAVPLRDQFPDYIIKLFDRAFNHKIFPIRPTPEDWIVALNTYSEDVRRCKNVHSHIYWKMLDKCPYCEANRRFANTSTFSKRQTTGGNQYYEPIRRPQPFFDKHWIS